MKQNSILMFPVMVICLTTTACSIPEIKSGHSLEAPMPTISGTEDDRRILAGEWEYEDGAVVTLQLDEQGNGSYAWKEGRFETRSFSGGTWKGMWFQKENDREGGFTVQFSADFSDGEGQWWYTRIGSDQAPTQKGGTFHLTRKPTATSAAATTLIP
jgi:hypothetical protein